MATNHDNSYDTGIYVKQGGAELHIGNPVSNSVDGKGAAIVQGPNSQIVALEFTFSPAAGAATICNVTIQAQDGLGNNITGPVVVDLWLSDAASGTGLTATTPSGGISVTTGTLFATLTTSKAVRAQTNATGGLVLQITDTARTGFFVAVDNGLNVPKVSAQLVTGNYG